MEKDNDSKEEGSDYSCSPVTKNELLTAAKYHAIKFAILFVLATSISLFLFICSKSLSRLLRVLHWKTKNERKFHLSLLSISYSRKSQFFQDFVFFHPSTSLHFIYYFPAVLVLFACSFCFFSYIIV